VPAATKLPIVEREALTLFYLRELSLEQVAEVLAVPVGTVKSRLFRARRMVRPELKLNAGGCMRDVDPRPSQVRQTDAAA
jgi:DNA-directed RNA polymerase specialized sigma24 family protein